MIRRQGLAGAAIDPVFRPPALRIDCRIRRQHGAVELFVGDLQSGRPLVVEVGERAFLKPRILSRRRHHRRLPDQCPRLGGTSSNVSAASIFAASGSIHSGGFSHRSRCSFNFFAASAIRSYAGCFTSSLHGGQGYLAIERNTRTREPQQPRLTAA